MQTITHPPFTDWPIILNVKPSWTKCDPVSRSTLSNITIWCTLEPSIIGAIVSLHYLWQAFVPAKAFHRCKLGGKNKTSHPLLNISNEENKLCTDPLALFKMFTRKFPYSEYNAALKHMVFTPTRSKPQQ